MIKADENRIEELLRQMTLDEKIDMIHGNAFFHTKGVERLGIPGIYTSDGPRGVRCEYHDSNWVMKRHTNDYSSYLPANSALAMSWNRELCRRAGRVLGEEARGRGKDVILAPGINIKRSPLCGRNFEYFSEDPYLIAELAVPLIEGIQENDVACSVKHFAANSQETDRLAVDTVVDERSLREIYLPGFKAAVERAGAYTVMGAYNKVNGRHCCHNTHLLNEILRDEWKYDGVIVSDWGGVHDTTEAAETELDLEMSVFDNFDDYYMANPLKLAVKEGKISEERIDRKVRNLLRMMLRLNMLGDDRKKRKRGAYNTPEHRAELLRGAEECITLLKNTKGKLPLDAEALRDKKLAVIGANADTIHALGGGSAEIKALYEISPLLGINMYLGGCTTLEYAAGYYVPEKGKVENEISWQATSTMTKEELDEYCKKDKFVASKETEEEIKSKSEKYLNAALKLAKEADEVIFVGGLNHDFDVEGGDRKDMKLPYGQDRLIAELLKIKPDMTIVMYAGSPVEMTEWIDNAENLVYMSYSGMEGGTALARVLFGEVNPSGKLAETFAKKYEDTPAYVIGEFATEGRVEYKDGLRVGYRYFDDTETAPLFEFGYGLSYTSFEYGEAVCSLDKSGAFKITVPVTNTGKCKGKETVQLYVAPLESSVYRPVQELKGFEKLELEPGETKNAEFILGTDSFAFFDEGCNRFVVEPGEFEIRIGASSRDIRTSVNIEF